MAEDMQFIPKSQVLTLEEMAFIAQGFVELGVSKIRLTGGEPLARNGVMQLVGELGQLPGLRELVMTTNGQLLNEYAEGLRDAGVRRLNISLDSLQEGRFRDITRFGSLPKVLAGIKAAQRAGFDNIKLNAVILAGVNDDEVLDLARFAVSEGMDISYIEEMPLGHIDSHRRADTQYFSDVICQQLQSEFQLTPSTESTGGPARYHRVAGTSSKIGFISPMSNNFCASCNRVRLTVQGQLLLCLGHDHSLDLKAVVRQFPGDLAKLKDAIVTAIGRKPEKHEFDPEKVAVVRFMNATGG
jgi:GTP 3',8-cyclase